MNPLIEKYEEVYGKKPVEGGLIEQIAGADSPDTIKVGDTVIPTAQVTPNGINLTGDYIDTGSVLNLNPAYITNGITCVNSNAFSSMPCYTKSFTIPYSTEVEKQFGKVMEDVGKSRATVTAISAQIDPTFTGFGGQIKYTVEIVGTYP